MMTPAEADRLSERLELAIARATARGVDLNLGKPIEEYEDYEPHRDPPRRRDVKHDEAGRLTDPGIPGVCAALGRQTRVALDPPITRHELAYAGAQMDPLELAAVLWCLNEDRTVRAHLKYELLKHALALKESSGWPKKVRRVDCEVTELVRCQWRYVEDLCTLAIREGAAPGSYATEASRAVYFGVTEQYWRRSFLVSGYAAIGARLTNWYRNGLADLSRRLVARAA
jgi:hypothetical protein